MYGVGHESIKSTLRWAFDSPPKLWRTRGFHESHLKMVGFPNNHGVFLLKMISTWGGDRGVPPFKETPIWRKSTLSVWVNDFIYSSLFGDPLCCRHIHQTTGLLDFLQCHRNATEEQIHPVVTSGWKITFWWDAMVLRPENWILAPGIWQFEKSTVYTDICSHNDGSETLL